MKVTIEEITLERLKKYSVTDGISWDDSSKDGMVEVELTDDIAKRLLQFQDWDDTEPPDYDFLLNELVDITEDDLPPEEKRMN